MSVECRVYSGIGIAVKKSDIKLRSEQDNIDYDGIYDYCINYLETYRKYLDGYREPGHVEIIYDGMCGQYEYLLYKLGSVDIYQEDCSVITADMNIYNEAKDKLKEAYTTITNQELNDDRIKFMTITHYF